MIILDGGMGQELVKRAGRATDLWSMQALLDAPQMVVRCMTSILPPERQLLRRIPTQYCQIGCCPKG
jgi:S-methylmethionine-dependent homocysteine/selenocysteine methylase